MSSTGTAGGNAFPAGDEIYRLMLDSIAQAVVGLDPVGIITYWNAAATRCFGWSEQEALGQHIQDLVAQEFTEADSLAIFERLLAKQSWQGEQTLVRRDGTRFPGRLVQNGVYSADGALVGMIGVTTDLTEQKRAEAADARWRAIVQQSADAALVVDTETWRVTFASPPVTRLFGWDVEQLVGQAAIELVHPDDRPAVTAAIRTLRRGPAERPIVEMRLLCADGSYLWVESAMSQPFLDGVPLGLVGNLRDITERRRVQHELQQRQRLMRALAARASDIAMVVSRDGSVRYTSRSASQLVVGGEGENWGRERFSHIHPDDRERFDQAMQAVRGPGATITVTHRRRSLDGGWRWCEQRVTNCMDDPDIQGMIVNLLDIHERVEAERALRESEARYRMIAETAQEGIAVTDPQGRIVFANRSMEQIYGIPLERLYTMTVYDLYPSEQHPEVVRLRDEIYAHGHYQFEFPTSRPDGAPQVLRMSASVMTDETGVVGILSMASDVTDAVAAAVDLEYRAFHDPLTGLGNRTLLLDRLRSDGTVAVLLADIDQFKLVNDSMGHATGDELLVAVSQRWRQALPASALLARIGGDEFVVVCEETTADGAAAVAARLHDALRAPIEISARQVSVRASIGIAIREAGADVAPDALLGHADAAMYEAKRLGRGRTAVFTADLITRAEKRLQLTNDLKAAIDGGELTLHYQPIVDLRGGRLRGIEALCRWQHPQRGAITPDEFIQAAEESGLIDQLDRWVLRQACIDAAALRAAGTLPHDAYVSVNCSAHNIGQPGFEESVRDALAEACLAADDLVLEVTESAVMDDPARARCIFDRLRELGVRLAIDDFGTGHSSLAYLRHFPIAVLKIDRSFVSGITTSRSDASIVSIIIDLARALGVTTVCEGIETAAELEMLRDAGGDAGQGWLWSRALPVAELCGLLATRPNGFAPSPSRSGSPAPLVPPRDTAESMAALTGHSPVRHV